MLRWCLNLCYAVFLVAVSPVIVSRMLRGKYRRGWGQKLLGLVPELLAGRQRIWFHAVSVGEVLQLRTIVAGLRERRPDLDVVVSTTTSTGHDVAKEKFPGCTVCFLPLDFTWAVSRAIARLRPTAIVLVELELWPNLLLAARRAKVPVGLVNGRLGERSQRGYARIRFLVRRLLGGLKVIAVQNETFAERFRDLGAPSHHVRVTGSVKFDHLETDRGNPGTLELRRAFGLGADDVVFVAGSTQAPEERLALKTFEALRSEFPNLRLVLVPRHAERFDEVAKLVVERGHQLVRRRERTESTTDAAAVRLLDTLGELGACWGLADVAFVGGSIVTSRGGQNMMEPAGYGAAVTFGPHTWNFAEVVASLTQVEAARVVRDGDEFTAAVRDLLERPEAAARMGDRAKSVVLAQRGATNRTLDAIESVLDDRRPTGLRRAA